jgi:DNA-binding LacI/PurR family transcriptional regulator
VVLDEIIEYLYQQNYISFIYYSKWDFERERKNIDSLISRRVDGVIISPVNDNNDNLELLSSQGIETVVIDCYANIKDKSYVFTDHAKAAEIATEYLIKNGHKEILLLTGPVHRYIEDNFVSGYKKILEKYNIQFKKEFIVRCDSLSIRGGYEKFKKLLTGKVFVNSNNFTAVLTICDLLAIGIYKVSNELGFRIPANYSIVGYDNIEVSSVLAPPLTTINQPRDVIGRESIEILLKNIQSKKKEHEIKIFIPNLIIRGSVRKLN